MTITINPATANINGTDYFLELGTIESTMLGKEDHGIFTYVLSFKFGGSGQGAGTLCLNDPIFFGTHIQALLNFFGGTWESLKGSRAFVLREEPYGLIRGLMDESQSKTLIFNEVSDSVEV